MHKASAVPLRAVRETQQEFIQAQAATTHQSLAMQQKARSQQEESLRVQESIIAQLASSVDTDPLRKLREKDPQFPAFTGLTDHFLPWLLECQTRKEPRNLPDAVVGEGESGRVGDSLAHGRCT